MKINQKISPACVSLPLQTAHMTSSSSSSSSRLWASYYSYIQTDLGKGGGGGNEIKFCSSDPTCTSPTTKTTTTITTTINIINLLLVVEVKPNY